MSARNNLLIRQTKQVSQDIFVLALHISTYNKESFEKLYNIRKLITSMFTSMITSMMLPGGSCGPDGQAELILISFDLTSSLTGEAGRVQYSTPDPQRPQKASPIVMS